MGTLFFAALGWCGTKYPGWWRRPKPTPDPDPVPWKPQPEPWVSYLAFSVIGIVAGIAGGTMFNDTIANDTVFAGHAIIASGMFGFAASAIVTGLASNMVKGKEVQ
ncbi:MAG: hypothetical protein ABI426_02480 [Flavobacterium sp.]